MSRIKPSGSEIERLLGRAMYSVGLRYRKQYRITGRPDFAFPGARVAVFADSDFWHGRNWETARAEIKVNREYWIPKIERNIRRDAEVNRILAEQRWTVLRFWENEIFKDSIGCALKVKRVVNEHKP